MKGNDWLGIVVILGVIVIGLMGGLENSKQGTVVSPKVITPEKQQSNIQKQINDAQKKVTVLQKQVQAEQEKKLASQYKDIVSIQSVKRSTDPKKEYIVLKVTGKTTQPINISGWTLTSTTTGATVKIPQASLLFFADSQNTEQDVHLQNTDTAYITTGYSPNGASFKVNKCSGYLTQFQTFTPTISKKCPLPEDEDTSSIPRTIHNEACLDYIDSMSQCKIQTKSLPVNWSYECTNFIHSKINYPSCVNTHKTDTDFYKNEWRIYLKRSSPLWRTRNENIILYDNLGKIVDIYKY